MERDRNMQQTPDKKKWNILWIIALVLFTPLAGWAIDSDVFSTRCILLLLVWTVVLLTPYVLTQKKPLFVVAASLLFADGFVNLFHWAVLKCPLNASSIFVFLNTNWSEASEFMSIKITPLLLLFIPYIALFVLTLRHVPRLSFKLKTEKIVWSALWLSVLVFFADNIVNKRFLRLAVPDVERAVASFLEESKAYKNLKTRQLYNLDANLSTNDSTLVVVIIGESCNRNHLSLYGYSRETTPRLQARKDILVFDNVISANSNTLSSVLNFLSENNIDHPLPIDSCIHIFDILHSSPYKSYWISNQSPIGLWDNGVTSLAQNADIKSFVNMTSNSSMESTTIASFDQRLFAPLLSVLKETTKHKFVFLHLMGCHTQYKKRYPDSFARYEDKGDKRTRVINSYDNAVLYNDFVVDSLFCMLDRYSRSHNGVRISAVYFSDHGENVYDEGDYCGHNYSGRIPDANVEIPFVLWFSDAQQKYAKEHYPFLEQRRHEPYMIDDLFHTLIELGNIETPCFDASRSFVNGNYNLSRKRILEDGSVYDAVSH